MICGAYGDNMDRPNPILTILMIVVFVMLAIALYPDVLNAFDTWKNDTPPAPTVVYAQPLNTQPQTIVITSAPMPTAVVQPTQMTASNDPTVEPTPMPVIEPTPEIVTGERIITFVDGSGVPVTGILVEHYIGNDLVKSVTNQNGQIKVFTDYIMINDGEWQYIEGMSRITVK